MFIANFLYILSVLVHPLNQFILFSKYGII